MRPVSVLVLHVRQVRWRPTLGGIQEGTLVGRVLPRPDGGGRCCTDAPKRGGLGEFAAPGGLAAPLGRPRPVFQGAWACLPPAAAPAVDRRSWRLQHPAALPPPA